MLLVAALGGCQPASQAVVAQPPVPVDGIGYVVLNAPIVAQTRDLLMRDVEGLVAAGARTIHLGINSPGGSIDAAQGIVDGITRLHATQGVDFEMYDIGLVASAASYVFLVGQKRFANPRSAFIFHAAGVTSTGPVSAERLRDQAALLDDYERRVRAMLKARTRLTDGETLTYVRRTVLLNADDARRDGIVDGIATFTVPKGARTWTISVTPPPGSRPATPPASAPPPN